MHTDPIADFLTRIRNAVRAEHQAITVPFSKIKYEMCDILKKHNFIVEYKKNALDKNKAEINIDLNPEVTKIMLKRVSKPGQRIYLGKSKIKSVRNNYGIAIYSTSRGLMTDKEARKNNIGGELICEIY